MTLQEISERIDGYLKKFEKENNQEVNGYKKFYHPHASWSGKYVYICYISYQHTSYLSKKEAEGYLSWLEAGNIGKHYDYQRFILQS